MHSSLVAQKERNEKRDTHRKINHIFASAISSDDNALAAIFADFFHIISVAVVLVHSFEGISAFFLRVSLAIVAQIIINNKIKCRRNLIVRKIAMLHIAHFIYLRSIFDGFPCEITKCACRNALNCHVDTHAKHNRAAEHTKESQTNETIQNYKNWSGLRSEGAVTVATRDGNARNGK